VHEIYDLTIIKKYNAIPYHKGQRLLKMGNGVSFRGLPENFKIKNLGHQASHVITFHRAVEY
jgi:hypothetical protein